MTLTAAQLRSSVPYDLGKPSIRYHSRALVALRHKAMYRTTSLWLSYSGYNPAYR